MFDLRAIGLPENAVIIDGGANRGQFIEACYAVVRHPRIISIEMLPDLARETQERHPNVTMLCCALSDGVMPTLSYHRTACTQMSSLYPASAEFEKHYPVQECREVSRGKARGMTLTAICEMLMLDHVDLLKLDLQGSELDALTGGLDILPMVQNIVCECEHVEIYRGQPLASDIVSFLRVVGFELRGSLDDHYRGPVLVAQDLWFTRAAPNQSKIAQIEPIKREPTSCK